MFPQPRIWFRFTHARPPDFDIDVETRLEYPEASMRTCNLFPWNFPFEKVHQFCSERIM